MDNEARKAVRGEETNVIELPTWEICEGIGFQSLLKTLLDELTFVLKPYLMSLVLVDLGVATFTALVMELIELGEASEHQHKNVLDLRTATRQINDTIQDAHESVIDTAREERQRQQALVRDPVAGVSRLGSHQEVGVPHVAMRGVMPSFVVAIPAPSSSQRSPTAASRFSILASSDGEDSHSLGDEDEDQGSAWPRMGKRMRFSGTQDVAQGVQPWVDVDIAREQGMLDGLAGSNNNLLMPVGPSALRDDYAPVNKEAIDLMAAGSHKRERQLQGAEPLSGGPRLWGTGHGGNQALHSRKGLTMRPFSRLHDEVSIRFKLHVSSIFLLLHISIFFSCFLHTWGSTGCMLRMSCFVYDPSCALFPRGLHNYLPAYCLPHQF